MFGKSPHLAVLLTFASHLPWDTAGEVTLRYAGGYDHLRQYFLTHGQGMYGHAIDIDDKMMIPEDIHHILLIPTTQVANNCTAYCVFSAQEPQHVALKSLICVVG